MNREFLRTLGLTDEQVDEVMKEHGKTVNDYKEKAEQTETLESQIEDYKEQIADRDKQLESLSDQVKDNEDLTATIKQLKADNETATQELQQKLEQQAFEFSLEKALNKAGAKNAKAVKALLDTDSIKLDGETLLGLDDQLKGLQESDPYLFGTDEPGGLKGRRPNDSNEPPKQNTLEDEYKKAVEQGDTATAIAIKNQMFEEQNNNNQE